MPIRTGGAIPNVRLAKPDASPETRWTGAGVILAKRRQHATGGSGLWVCSRCARNFTRTCIRAERACRFAKL